MNRYALLALGLALTLPCAGSRANDQTGAIGTDNQSGTTGTNGQPATVPANPQPGLNQTAPQAPLGQNNQQPNNDQLNQQNNAGQLNQQPNNNQLNPQPNNGLSNQQPNAGQTNQQPGNGQFNQQPNNGQFNQQQNNGLSNQQPNAGQTNQQPNGGQTGTSSSTTSGSTATAQVGSPLQQFVGRQVDEVAALQPQFDVFRAANRPEAVRVLYHMVRDHVLVADAARNLLARRGQVSRPAMMPTNMVMAADSPEQMIRQDIDAHQQTLTDTQQMMANASTPEERSIYQQSINATQKHLNWLRALDQGQQVALGYFGPTVPLNRIAGYREQVGQSTTSGGRTARPASYSQRSHHHRYHYHHRYSNGYHR
jgi:hypothetical protein